MCYPETALNRRSTEQDDEDQRSAFARDRDRLLYSTAFRQLAGKSQVVASTEIGVFHTRLTHSLKVAQLGRRLAEQLRDQYAQDDAFKCGHPDSPHAPDPDLVEFACLAHDIGHPPFGHTGERELDRTVNHLVRQAVDHAIKDAKREAKGKDHDAIEERRKEFTQSVCNAFGGFEGNPQSFRIVTRLAHKAVSQQSTASRSDDPADNGHDYFGLDLTAAAIDAVTKYPWEFGRNSKKPNKWGAYGICDDPHSDFGILQQVRQLTGADPSVGPSAEQSFESQLMDWCDDVTYAVHDVEDFYMIGMIPLGELFGYRQMFSALDQQEPLADIGNDPLDDDGRTDIADGDGHDEQSQQNDSSLTAMDSDKGVDHQPARYLASKEWERFRSFIAREWKNQPCQPEVVCEDCGSGDACDVRREYIDGLRNELIEIAYGETGADIMRDSIQAHRWSQRRASNLIEYFAGDNIGYLRRPLLHEGELVLSRHSSIGDRDQDTERRIDMCDILKKLIWKYVIRSSNLATQQVGQRKIIRELVEAFAADTVEGESEILPNHFVELIPKGAGCEGTVGSGETDSWLSESMREQLRSKCARVRIAADYIASLTEAQAVVLHKRLTGSELGGLRDIF